MKTNLIDLKSSPALAFPPEEWKSAGAAERLARIRKRLVENRARDRSCSRPAIHRVLSSDSKASKCR